MDLDYWAMTPLLVAYEDMAAGRPVDLLRFPEISKHGAAWALEQRVICELLAALQLDTRSPNEAKLLNYARATPTNRQLMIALEKYAQKWNLPQANGLREGWGWLHPDDPWSKSPSEKPSPPPLTGDALLAILSGFNAEPYPVNTMEKTEAAKMVFAKVSPWEVLAVVRQLLEQKQPDKALLIALKYRHATASMLYPQLRVFANHLVYEIKRINAGKHPPLIPLDIEGSGRPV